MWNQVLDLFREYMGTGLIVIWFLASVIYLWLTEKRKPIRIMFLYVPVILLVMFFNPLFAGLVYAVVGEEIYYRILWLLPITVVIALAVVDVMWRLQGVRKLAFGLTAAVVLMASGSCIYSNPYFVRAENLYHMPQEVVDICDAIEVKGREVKAVFPNEMIQYVRQYSPTVCMPYGRNILVGEWAIQHDIYTEMQQETLNAERMAALCREYECHYIVLEENRKIQGNFSEYSFEVFGQLHGYTIYKDAKVNLTSFLEK